jgi:hypothetical protein
MRSDKFTFTFIFEQYKINSFVYTKQYVFSLLSITTPLLHTGCYMFRPFLRVMIRQKIQYIKP